MSDLEITTTSSTPQKDSGAVVDLAKSRRRPGYWCNQFFCHMGWNLTTSECRLLTQYVCEHLKQFKCPQEAEQYALKGIARLSAPGGAWHGKNVKYMGAYHYK